MAAQTDNQLLALRPPERFFYPGKVRKQENGRLQVLFEDGAEAWLRPDQTMDLFLEPGDRVQVRVPLGRDFVEAKVLRWNGATVLLEHAEGDQETTSLGMIRVDRDRWKVSSTQRPKSPWIVGDRVWGQWSMDQNWYPATIQEVATELHVLFDDGDRERLPANKVRKLEVSVAQKLECRMHKGAIFVPCKVVQVEGERLTVRYQDGLEETTLLGLTRIATGKSTRPASGFRQGERVLSVWLDGLIYPATVAGNHGSVLDIQYDDGDRAQIPPDQVFPLRLKVGWYLQARKDGGPYYTSGRLREIRGNDLLVDFDDGTTIWVKLAWIRLAAADLT